MICGKYGSTRIADTPAPTDFDQCPDGYSICNPKTEGQNFEAQFCLSNELFPQECPVIEFKFYPTDKLSELNDQDWIKLDYREGTQDGQEEPLSLVYTKNASSNAPITHTYVGIAPCLDPEQLVKKASISHKAEQNPFERTQDTCSSKIRGRPDVDDRYSVLSTADSLPKFSELDVQYENGTLDLLAKYEQKEHELVA